MSFKVIAEKQGHVKCVLKAIEELNELATVLAQTLTKGDIPPKRVEEEMGDVFHRLNVLKTFYDSDKVQKREKHKLNKSLAN